MQIKLVLAIFSITLVSFFLSDRCNATPSDVEEIVAEWEEWREHRPKCHMTWLRTMPNSRYRQRTYEVQIVHGEYLHRMVEVQDAEADELDGDVKWYVTIANPDYAATVESLTKDEWVLSELHLPDAPDAKSIKQSFDDIDLRGKAFNGWDVNFMHPTSDAYSADYDPESNTLTCVALDPAEAAKGLDRTPLKVVYTLRQEVPRLPVKIVAEAARGTQIGTVGKWEERCGVLIFDTWTWSRPGKGGRDDQTLSVWTLLETDDRPMDTSLCYLSAYGIAEPDLGWGRSGWLWFAAAVALLLAAFVFEKKRRESSSR